MSCLLDLLPVTQSYPLLGTWRWHWQSGTGRGATEGSAKQEWGHQGVVLEAALGRQCVTQGYQVKDCGVGTCSCVTYSPSEGSPVWKVCHVTPQMQSNDTRIKVLSCL